MLLGYTRSLTTMGLILLLVLCVGLWFWNRTVLLSDLTRTGYDLKTQASGNQTYATVIAEYENRLETVRAEIGKLTARFANNNYNATRLMQDIVKAASQTGIEMTNASQLDKKKTPLTDRDKTSMVRVLAHAITLKGSYTGLVKFLQNIAAWNIACKIESVDVTSIGEGRNDIEASLILSVFSLEMETPPAETPAEEAK